MGWQPGETIVRRELLRGRPWLVTVVLVVADEHDLLVTYLPEGAPFGFPEGAWPMLDAGSRWWDEAWSRWSPPPDWAAKPLPEGWDVV